MTQAFELPKYHELSDQELHAVSNVEFVDNMLLARSYALGENFLNRKGWEYVELDEETKRQNLAEYCRRTAWMEYWMGVHPAAKQLVILEKDPENISFSVRLSQQIMDEVEHQRTFAKWVKHFGGNPRLQDFQPEEDQLKMYRATFNFDTPIEIAASNQCTGEAILSYHQGGIIDPSESLTYPLLPAELREDIAKNVMAHEPRHIAVGRDIIIKFSKPEDRRRLLEIQINKMKKYLVRVVKDQKLLGAERVAPLPIVD